MSMCAALESALAEVEVTAADAAAVALAKQYAEAIDHGDTEDSDPLATYGPKLLACLDALRLTPKARTAVVNGGKRDRPESPLDQLRARRASRTDGTPTVDPAAS